MNDFSSDVLKASKAFVAMRVDPGWLCNIMVSGFWSPILKWNDFYQHGLPSTEMNTFQLKSVKNSIYLLHLVFFLKLFTVYLVWWIYSFVSILEFKFRSETSCSVHHSLMFVHMTFLKISLGNFQVWALARSVNSLHLNKLGEKKLL